MPHILLVDDDASLLATLRTCLEVDGFICTEAKDGDGARQCLENETPDLIVTDHQMQKVTSLELIKGLKNPKTQKRYPLFFIAGN